MSKVRGLLALLGALGSGALAPHARADEVPLDVAQVVRLARANSPALKASMLTLEQSRWDVFGRESVYEPVLLIDGTGSQIATPNVLGGAVRINRVRRGELGAQLSKHFLWGTDLSLRLSTSVQASRFSGGITALPTTNTGGTGTTGTGALAGFAGFGFGTFGPIYGLNAKLSLKQPLWRGRGRDVGEASMREAREQRTGAEHARDRVASALLRDALTAYWELWYADAALSIQRGSQGLATKQRDEASARARTGSLAPAEVLTFDTQVATREEEVLEAETERARRSHELARVLGLRDDAAAEAGFTLSEQPAEARLFVRDEVEESAVAQAAEVRERASAAALARIRQRTADDPSKPRLDLEGYVQAQGLGNESVNDAASQFVGGETLSALLTLTYEAPVRDRVRRAEAAKARLASEVALEELRQARQQVLADARSALDRAENGARKVALSERTAEIAARQLAAEQARYQSGASTSLSVLEAEDKLRAAQLRLARARADRAEVALVIDHLTGALLKRHAPE